MSYNSYGNIDNLDYLEREKSEIYNDCCFYNDCGICPHANEFSQLCDLSLITKRIEQLYQTSKEL